MFLSLEPPLSHNSTCNICPPVKSQKLSIRFKKRFELLKFDISMFRLPIGLFLLPILIILIVLAEFFYTSYFQFQSMGPKVLVGVLITILVIAAQYLYVQGLGNQPVPSIVNLLFDVFIACSATYIGVAYSEKKAEKNATSKWLPAAENACLNLLTLSSNANRIIESHLNSCDLISPAVQNLKQQSDKDIIEHSFTTICKNIRSEVKGLQLNIDTAYENWGIFIRENCEGDKCEQINQNLMKHKNSLAQQITPLAQSSIAITNPSNHDS